MPVPAMFDQQEPTLVSPKPYEVPRDSLNNFQGKVYSSPPPKSATANKLPQTDEQEDMPHLYEDIKFPGVPGVYQQILPSQYRPKTVTPQSNKGTMKAKMFLPPEYDLDFGKQQNLLISSPDYVEAYEEPMFPSQYHPEMPSPQLNEDTVRGKMHDSGYGQRHNRLVGPPEHVDANDFSSIHLNQKFEATSAMQHSERKRSPSLIYDDISSGLYKSNHPPAPPHPTYSHLASIHPSAVEAHDLAYRQPPLTQLPEPLAKNPNRIGSTSSVEFSHDKMQFSFHDLTKEQLLAYIQAIQTSQSTYPELPLSGQSDSTGQKDISPRNVSLFAPSESTAPKKQDLYVNIAEELPPPLPPKPKPKWAKSSEDIRRLPLTSNSFERMPHEAKNSTGISKSQSVLLHGSSAEAIRQRYHYQGKPPRIDYPNKVHFQLVEEDEDEVFAQQAQYISEKCPPVPPRIHTRQDANFYHNFDSSEARELKPNIPKRSHTMKPYLASEIDYRRKYTSRDTSHSSQDLASKEIQFGYHESSPQLHQLCLPMGHHHANQSDTEEMRAMLGKLPSLFQCYHYV